MFERRLISHVDWVLFGAVLAIAGFGLAMIYSTTFDVIRGTVGPQFWTQLYAVGLGLFALLICLVVDYRRLAERSLAIYIALALLLLYVLLFGVTAGGARRWINLGFFNLQPSEFAKIALALTVAMFFAENRHGAREVRDLLFAAGFLLVFAVLIAREPDLGTAVTLVPIFLGIAFVAGLRTRFLAWLIVLALVAAPVAWAFALKDYQKSRIETFLDPEKDAQGAGYQQIQARITVGSGGLTGKGYMQGTQGQFKFLPVAHNDFIYSVLAEELGFVGVLVTLGLYLLVIVRALDAAKLAKDRLGAYLVVGLVSGFSFQVIYNITMSAGLAPVKGLTLPLMSYGGSSMIATLASFGLILNVRMRRFTN
ncbi:MAG: mrdB [Acidobacteria bacterium]|jgi:rod shape determining protein RodA|nr:mrdB [Acidobacteriota bacterium]